MNFDEYRTYDATGLAKLVADKQVSAKELLTLAQDRAAAVNSRINAIVDKNLGWVPYTQLANITGRPAISLPLHWTADGLPLGVQFRRAAGRRVVADPAGRATRAGGAVG